MLPVIVVNKPVILRIEETYEEFKGMAYMLAKRRIT